MKHVDGEVGNEIKHIPTVIMNSNNERYKQLYGVNIDGKVEEISSEEDYRKKGELRKIARGLFWRHQKN